MGAFVGRILILFAEFSVEAGYIVRRSTNFAYLAGFQGRCLEPLTGMFVVMIDFQLC